MSLALMSLCLMATPICSIAWMSTVHASSLHVTWLIPWPRDVSLFFWQNLKNIYHLVVFFLISFSRSFIKTTLCLPRQTWIALNKGLAIGTLNILILIRRLSYHFGLVYCSLFPQQLLSMLIKISINKFLWFVTFIIV